MTRLRIRIFNKYIYFRKGLNIMRNLIKRLSALIAVALMLFAMAAPVYAAEDDAADNGSVVETVVEEDAAEDGAGSSLAGKAIGAGVCVGLAALGGSIGMGLTVAKSEESIARQPEAGDDVRSAMMLGIVFIETAIIYALIISILIIFVL